MDSNYCRFVSPRAPSMENIETCSELIYTLNEALGSAFVATGRLYFKGPHVSSMENIETCSELIYTLKEALRSALVATYRL